MIFFLISSPPWRWIYIIEIPLQCCGSEGLLIGSGSGSDLKVSFVSFLRRIYFVRIQIVWFHSQLVGYITKYLFGFITNITKYITYLFNLLYFLYVL